MAGLEDKSKDNENAAKLLKGNTYYTSSIHCAYYSVIQYLKYTLTILFDTTYKQLSKECKNRTYGISSHEFYINYIKNKRSDLQDNEELGNFINDIGCLKELRNKADYEEDILDSKDSEYALKTAVSLKKYLKTNTKLWKKK